MFDRAAAVFLDGPLHDVGVAARVELDFRAGRGEFLLVGCFGVIAQCVDPALTLLGLQGRRCDEHEKRFETVLVLLLGDGSEQIERFLDGFRCVRGELQAREQNGRIGIASGFAGLAQRLHGVGDTLLGQAHARQTEQRFRITFAALQSLECLAFGQRHVAEPQRGIGQIQPVLGVGAAVFGHGAQDGQALGFAGGEQDLGIGAPDIGQTRSHLHGGSRVVESFLQFVLREQLFRFCRELAGAPVFDPRNGHGGSDRDRGKHGESDGKEAAHKKAAPLLPHFLGAHFVVGDRRNGLVHFRDFSSKVRRNCQASSCSPRSCAVLAARYQM